MEEKINSRDGLFRPQYSFLVAGGAYVVAKTQVLLQESVSDAWDIEEPLTPITVSNVESKFLQPLHCMSFPHPSNNVMEKANVIYLSY